jgi:hypothetical protein
VIVVPTETPLLLTPIPEIRVPVDAVTIPVIRALPLTVSFDDGLVVPIPTLSTLTSTYRLESETKLAVYLVLSAIGGFLTI